MSSKTVTTWYYKEQRFLIKQQILIYKTTLNTLLNGRITRHKMQISEKRRHYSAVHSHFGNVKLHDITFFLIFAVFGV